MSLQTRAAIIDQLGQELKSPVIAYVTGDRQGMETQIGPDQVPLLPRHLTTLGKQDRLNLFLYTRGGDTNVPWTVVNYLREHCDHLAVLVPFVSHSSGTLITLGADELLMGRFATLSPIDPSVANAFNPQDPANPVARLPIAVEDVLAYMDLANTWCSEKADRAEAFKRLSESVHPLALGNVQRSINQIQQLARKLLRLHPPKLSDADETALVKRLTTEFYSHLHLINRREAKELGLPVTDPSDVVERLMSDYYDALKADLVLLDPFDPGRILAAVAAQQPTAPPGQAQPLPAGPPGAAAAPTVPAFPTLPVALERAYIETATTCDAYITRAVLGQQMVPVQMPGGGQITQQAIAVDVSSERWELMR